MPGESGPALLPRILGIGEHIAVILMTAMPQVRTAVEAIKAGAYDYVIKPFEPDEILLLVRQAAQHRMLEREVRYLRSEFDLAHGFDQLVGRHARMVAALRDDRPGRGHADATVLITARAARARSSSRARSTGQSPRRDAAVRRRQLRRHSRHADRVRAVRSREGRVHRARSRASRALRARARRHAVPRRGRRACASTCRRSSCAPCRSVRCERLGGVRTTPSRRARHRRDEHRPAPGGRGRAPSARISSTG